MKMNVSVTEPKDGKNIVEGIDKVVNFEVEADINQLYLNADKDYSKNYIGFMPVNGTVYADDNITVTISGTLSVKHTAAKPDARVKEAVKAARKAKSLDELRAIMAGFGA